MKQLERLVVHVEEAIRYGTATDAPHLRLGLLLIDSAAELMMYRETDYLLRWGAKYEEWLKQAEESAAHGFGDQNYIDELRGKVFSKTQRGKIERDYNAKCDLLVKEDILQAAQARVLKKLTTDLDTLRAICDGRTALADAIETDALHLDGTRQATTRLAELLRVEPAPA